MKIKYVLRKNEHGDVLGCNSCGCEVPTAHFEGRELCSLCSTTFVGNATKYPTQYTEFNPKMLAQIAHWIVQEIRKGK